MLASPQLPVIFLACVNSYQKGRRLRYLVHERKAIAQLMTARSAPYYQPVQKGNRAHSLFLDLPVQEQHRVTHLHLVGHTDSSGIRIESENFETTVSMASLGQLIDLLPNLCCVFLSGCATNDVIDLLLRKDVPAIIATQTRNRDHAATSIAKAFYEHLAQGESVEAAYKALQATQAGMQTFEVRYDFEGDEMQWLGKEEQGEEVAWGMYYLVDNLHRLREAPRPRQVIPYGQPGTKNKWAPRRVMRYAATAVSLGLLAVGIALYLHQASDWHQLMAFW